MEAAKRKIAVIGAGVSGLSLAYALRAVPQLHIDVFEKSRGVSGRSATRRHEPNHQFDFGANYIQIDRTHELGKLLLQSPNCKKFEGVIQAFNSDSSLLPIDEERVKKDEKFTMTGGMSEIGKMLAAHSENTSVLKETLITKISKNSSREWELTDQKDKKYSGYELVVMTPPAPQTHKLLSEMELAPGTSAEAVQRLFSHSNYRAIITVSLCVKKERVPKSLDRVYALINSDRKHGISWVSRESFKPNRVGSQDLEILVVQMSNGWSLERWEKTKEEIVEEAKKELEKLMGNSEGKEEWADVQKWRYALPDLGYQKPDAEGVKQAAEIGLHFCGDMFIGAGRVMDAMISGYERGLELASLLSKPKL